MKVRHGSCCYKKEIRQSLSSQGMTRYSPREQKKLQKQGVYYRFTADGVRIVMIGSQSRIGTTTTALGFAAWFGSVGASVTYVGKNGSGIIPYLRDAYEMDEEASRSETDADILLLICGTKPYEIVHTMSLLEQYETKTAFVLCPFVEKALQDTYAEAFQTDCHKVLFLEYQPDCMNCSSNAKVFKNVVERYIAED